MVKFFVIPTAFLTLLFHSKTNIVTQYGSKNVELDKKYSAKTTGQIEYKTMLYDNNINIVICSGPAGSGKTTLACEYSLDLLSLKKVDKIVITRPTISIEEDLGYLPGDINHKMSPWTAPIFDIFLEYYKQEEINTMIDNKIIEVCPLGFIQGRTFKNAIIIADEMQNSSPQQTLMLLTRLGTNSKMILTGDLKQTTISKNGLSDIIRRLKRKYKNEDKRYSDGFGLIELTKKDVQRHKIIEKILKLYETRSD